jgi:hypothetical protein
MEVKIEVISCRISKLVRMEGQISKLADLECQMVNLIALRRTVRGLYARRARPKGFRRPINYASVRNPITARPSFAGTSISRR